MSLKPALPTKSSNSSRMSWPGLRSGAGRHGAESQCGSAGRDQTLPRHAGAQFELNRRRFELLSLECGCVLDAMVPQPHDVFRFSHPMPGWGTSGRVRAGSTVGTVYLDTPVAFQAGLSYHLYLRFDFDAVDIKPVVNPGAGTYHVVTMAVPFAQQPDPDVPSGPLGSQARSIRPSNFFGSCVSSARAIRRCISKLLRTIPRSMTRPLPHRSPSSRPCLIHSGPATAGLFGGDRSGAGQTSGASLRAVDLSWDVAALSSGYAPYGGAAIFRRSVVLESAVRTSGCRDHGPRCHPGPQ